MKYRYEYMNMVDLGRLFGVSGQKIGKWLKELGLRTSFGSPTRDAFEEKLMSYDYEQWGTYTKLWHVERTVRLLEEAGHQRVVDPPTDLVEPPSLSGPFSLRHSDDDRWQIIGKDDAVAIVVTGETNARVVQRVMNIALRAGMLEKILATTT